MLVWVIKPSEPSLLATKHHNNITLSFRINAGRVGTELVDKKILNRDKELYKMFYHRN